jgi:hypothetical protein
MHVSRRLSLAVGIIAFLMPFLLSGAGAQTSKPVLQGGVTENAPQQNTALQHVCHNSTVFAPQNYPDQNPKLTKPGCGEEKGTAYGCNAPPYWPYPEDWKILQRENNNCLIAQPLIPQERQRLANRTLLSLKQVEAEGGVWRICDGDPWDLTKVLCDKPPWTPPPSKAPLKGSAGTKGGCPDGSNGAGPGSTNYYGCAPQSQPGPVVPPYTAPVPGGYDPCQNPNAWRIPQCNKNAAPPGPSGPYIGNRPPTGSVPPRGPNAYPPNRVVCQSAGLTQEQLQAMSPYGCDPPASSTRAPQASSTRLPLNGNVSATSPECLWNQWSHDLADYINARWQKMGTPVPLKVVIEYTVYAPSPNRIDPSTGRPLTQYKIMAGSTVSPVPLGDYGNVNIAALQQQFRANAMQAVLALNSEQNLLRFPENQTSYKKRATFSNSSGPALTYAPNPCDKYLTQ